MMETKLTALPKLFIGLDIHKKSWTVHFRTDISDHKTLTIPADQEVLYRYVATHFADHEVMLTYEAGCCGFAAGRHFLGLGWQVKIVNAADVPRMDKQNYQKTDKIDSRNLSRQLQGGGLRGIYIPSQSQDELKCLLRQRALIAKQLRHSKLSIKSLLLYHGIKIPDQYDNPHWSKDFLSWLQELSWDQTTGRSCMESKLRMYGYIHQEYLHLSTELRAWCRKYRQKDYYLLKSVPGVGGYLSAAILAEVGDLRRFSSATHFASYVGLVPTMYNSGGREHVFGVTPRCKALLRSYIIESAWVALRMDPQMQAYYRSHFGKNPKAIIIKIARKLLNRMLSVIKNEVPYRINYNGNMEIKTA